MSKSKLYLGINSAAKILISISPLHKKLVLLEYPKSGGTWIAGLISSSTSFDFTEGLPSFYCQNHLIHTHRPSLIRCAFRIAYKVLLVRNPYDTYISLYYHCLFLNGNGNNVLVDSVRNSMKDAFQPEDFSYSFLNFLNLLFTGRFKYLTNWSSFYERIDPDLFYVLRYEDLWDDPIRHLETMFANLNLECDILKLSIASSTSRSQILAARQSFDSSQAQLADIVSFQRRGGYGGWKDILNDSHISLIYNASSKVMDKFGY